MGWLQKPSVRFGLLTALFAALLSVVDLGALISQFRHLDARYLAAMLGVNVLSLAIGSWRWFLLATTAGIDAPWPIFLRITWISWAVAECGPSLVVSEWARFRLMRGRATPVPLAISQFVDRLSAYVGLLVLALVTLLGGLETQWSPNRAAVVLGAVAVSGLVMVTLMMRRFRVALDRDPTGLLLLRTLLVQPLPYLLSLLANILFAVNFTFAAMAVGVRVDGWTIFALAPLVLMGTGSLPSLVSDWGKREAAATVALGQIGLGAEPSLAVSLVYGAMNLVSALPGLIGLLRVDTRKATDGAPNPKIR